MHTRAHRYLEEDPKREAHLSATALGEFSEGLDDSEDPVLRIVRESHVLLETDEETVLAYGRITRRLRAEGRLIGTNDLWIAAASIRHGIPLVTANTRDFTRIEGLDVVRYR